VTVTTVLLPHAAAHVYRLSVVSNPLPGGPSHALLLPAHTIGWPQCSSVNWHRSGRNGAVAGVVTPAAVPA
jgi:hypothetical protein